MYEDTLQSYTQGNHPTIFLCERTYIGRDSKQYWSACEPILLRPVTYMGRNSNLYRFASPPRAYLLFPYTAGMESRGISLI